MRTKTFKNKDGSARVYLYLVETRRVDGKIRQEIIANLGGLDKLQEDDLDSIIEGLTKYAKTEWIRAKARSIDPKWAKDLSPTEVFRKLWEDLNLTLPC